MSILREILSTPPSRTHDLHANFKTKFVSNSIDSSHNFNSTESNRSRLSCTTSNNESNTEEHTVVTNKEMLSTTENEILRSTLKQLMLRLDHRTSIQLIAEVLMEIIRQKRSGKSSPTAEKSPTICDSSRIAPLDTAPSGSLDGRDENLKSRNETEYLASNSADNTILECTSNLNSSRSPQSNKRMFSESVKVSRKSSKHNASVYYPSIRCILCREWVCIRNKIAHIESHFRYRPYKCNMCDYANRKEIFVSLHVQNTHNGNAAIICGRNTAIENEVARLAEECVTYTETVLASKLETIDNQLRYNDDELARPNVLRSLLDQFPALSNCLSGEQSSSILENFHPRVSNARREAKNAMFEEAKRARLQQFFPLESLTKSEADT